MQKLFTRISHALSTANGYAAYCLRCACLALGQDVQPSPVASALRALTRSRSLRLATKFREKRGFARTYLVLCFAVIQPEAAAAGPSVPEEVRKALEAARLKAQQEATRPTVPFSPQVPPGSPFQPAPRIVPLSPSGVPGTASESPSTFAETLAQAAADLKNPREELRESAAKLLGKYTSTQAGSLLVSVLGDSSIKVRRAAVRSLMENMAFHGKTDSQKLLSMLGDADVEVRREISKAIPILRSRLSLSSTVTRVINGRAVTTSRPYQLPPELAKVVTGALGDEDGLVRQNVLRYYSYLNLPFSAALLEPLLGDPERGVVETAMSRIRMVPRTPPILARVQELSTSEDDGLRRKLIASLRGMSDPGILSIQTQLTKDPDPYVRIMAAVSLVGAGKPLPRGTVQGVKDFLMRVDSANSQIMSLFYSISDFGEPHAREIYTLLTTHKNSSLRRSAWQRVLNYDNGWNNPAAWVPVMEDPDKRVRQSVSQTVESNQVPVPVVSVEKLVESEFADVRALAGKLLARHSADTITDLMFDLLIDEEPEVRRSILQSLYNKRVDGWQKLLQKSLGDEDTGIQRTAAYGLLGDFGNSGPLLRRWISENPASPVAIEIARQLSIRSTIPRN